MKKVITTCISLLLVVLAWSQDGKFSVTVNADSLLLGNYLEVRFTLENTKGNNFQPPPFTGFDLVGGPNHASSMSIINGVVSQTQSFTYFVSAKEPGNFFIEPASIDTDEGVLETRPVEILVLPNPDGIQQKQPKRQGVPDIFSPREIPPKPVPDGRKKRRIYQI